MVKFGLKHCIQKLQPCTKDDKVTICVWNTNVCKYCKIRSRLHLEIIEIISTYDTENCSPNKSFKKKRKKEAFCQLNISYKSQYNAVLMTVIVDMSNRLK